VRYEAILFDFDGVLVDSEPVHFECWREVLQDFDIELDWNTYSHHGIGVSDRVLMGLLCKRAGRPRDVDRVIAEFPRKKALFQRHMRQAPPFTADVLELLPQLRDYQLAVVTSSTQAEVEPILLHAGIDGCFRTIVYGSDVKRLKPAPDPYLLAIERLRVNTALAVEDSDAGEASARAAGLDVLRIPTQSKMPELLRQWLA